MPAGDDMVPPPELPTPTVNTQQLKVNSQIKSPSPFLFIKEIYTFTPSLVSTH